VLGRPADRGDDALVARAATERARDRRANVLLRQSVAAEPSHRLAGKRSIAPSELASERWLVGPPDLDPTTSISLFLERNRLEGAEIETYTSHVAAIAAAAAGEGVVLALAHSVLDQVRRRALVRLDVRGTPIIELWHASTLGLGRAIPVALTLQRFATTPEATQAISTGRAGTASARARRGVHVTLWRSLATAPPD